jgi:hypothetical protein
MNFNFAMAMDRNGNKVIIIKPMNARAFSIQTNASSFPKTSEMGNHNFDREMALVEITDYVRKYGTPRQKSIMGVD